jgi:hypothetical protein
MENLLPIILSASGCHRISNCHFQELHEARCVASRVLRGLPRRPCLQGRTGGLLLLRACCRILHDATGICHGARQFRNTFDAFGHGDAAMCLFMVIRAG